MELIRSIKLIRMDELIHLLTQELIYLNKTSYHGLIIFLMGTLCLGWITYGQEHP